MKKIIIIVSVITIILIGCSGPKNAIASTNISKNVSDTVRIANDSLEYEVIIIEPGFNSWLASQARPRKFYSESYMEGRNQLYVTEWNNRVLQPFNYNANLYEMRINYDSNVHYGYEVNYLIYNYFIYFQLNYKQQLAGFVPRI